MKIDWGSLSVKIEKIFFPLVFSFFSLTHFFRLYSAVRIYLINSPKTLASAEFFIFRSGAVYFVFLIIFNIIISYALVVSKNLHHKPEGWKEILIPLAATFWYATYSMASFLPDETNFLVIPPRYSQLLSYPGICLAILGLAIASASIIHMRRSFSIFVQVRDIVTRGLYKYIRHPMYCGHILSSLGFVLLDPRIFSIILYSLGVVLTVWRALLEEEKLSRFSPEYRRYMGKTPFLIPFRFN